MSLPAPNLDDRKAQDIVDDAKPRIGLMCPEWSDHNVSDPGVTLIELFAWMTELTLYRLNQVPERNYVKFLEMLGITLESAVPAQTDLRFMRTRPIYDAKDEEAYEKESILPPNTVAATVRTETEEAIEFSTDSVLRLVRPRLVARLAVPVQDALPGRRLLGARAFALPDAIDNLLADEIPAVSADGRPVERPGFQIYSESPKPGDALYLAFDADISGNIVQIDVECLKSAAPGLVEEYPAQVWESWNAADAKWDPLECLEDSSKGFNIDGHVQLAMPPTVGILTLNDIPARWIRVRYAPDLPIRQPGNVRPSKLTKSPQVYAIKASTIGGTVSASNSVTVYSEVLGESDNTPGQVFQLSNYPILPRRAGEGVYIGPAGAPLSEMEAWTEVSDFSESSSESKHYTCDSYSGEIAFGPNIVEPKGKAEQYGAVPPANQTIIFSAYRYGGGTVGNVLENQVRVLKSSIPYISDVWNCTPATGGQDTESLEHAKMKARAMLRSRDRAVTAKDYEYLAMGKGVGRARCVQPAPLHERGTGSATAPPGVVQVLIIPTLADNFTVPRPLDLAIPPRVKESVSKKLDQRRLLTAVLEVRPPEYVYVSTEITLAAQPDADPEMVRRDVQARLEKFVHPLTGGADGKGWPFGVSLKFTDLYSQIGAVRGVAFLTEAAMFTSHEDRADAGRLTSEVCVPITESIELAAHQMLATREHRIKVLPFGLIGQKAV